MVGGSSGNLSSTGGSRPAATLSAKGGDSEKLGIPSSDANGRSSNQLAGKFGSTERTPPASSARTTLLLIASPNRVTSITLAVTLDNIRIFVYPLEKMSNSYSSRSISIEINANLACVLFFCITPLNDVL